MRSSGRGSRFIAAAIGLSLLALISTGQTQSPAEVRISSHPYQPQSPAIRVERNEVQVGVVVRDSKGQIVSGLKPEDFALYDSGKKQTVSQFSIETRTLRAAVTQPKTAAPATADLTPQQPEKPRYVALYFDDLNTKFGDIRHVQLAAENFIHTGVSPNDKIALFTASGSQAVDFTPDPSEVLDAIGKLKFRGRAIESVGCPRITAYDAYEIANQLDPATYQVILQDAIKCNCIDQTNLDIASCGSQQVQMIRVESKEMWDSILAMSKDTLNNVQAVVNYLAKRPGERVLVLASSGFMTGTLETDVDSLVNSALRADVVINALDAKGLYTEFPNQGQMDGQTVDTSTSVAVHEAQSFGPAMTSATAAMADFAVGTGGRFFHNRNDIGAGYYSLAAAPETEYLLGFAPENEKLNDAFHKLKVEVNGPGKFSIEARPGYFATKKESTDTSVPTPEERIDAEMRASDEKSDIPATVSDSLATAKSGAREITVKTLVDIQKLPFQLQQDRHVEQLTFVDALYDSQGKLVTGKVAEMD